MNFNYHYYMDKSQAATWTGLKDFLLPFTAGNLRPLHIIASHQTKKHLNQINHLTKQLLAKTAKFYEEKKKIVLPNKDIIMKSNIKL